MCLHPKDILDEIESNPNNNLSNLINLEENPLITSCVYYEPAQVKYLNGKQYKLRVLHLNIRTLPSSFDKLVNLLQKLKEANCEIDIVLLCETNITTNTIMAKCQIEGYDLLTKSRTERVSGGGIGMYVSKKLSYVPREDLIIFDEYRFESYFIEIAMENNRKVIVGEIYRVPNSGSVYNFIQEYEKIIGKMENENAEIIIGTDQNIDYLKIDSNLATAHFLETNLNAGIVPHILMPTRITHDTATLIDNIYTKLKNIPKCKSAILTSDISDHFPCVLLIDEKPLYNRKSTEIKYRKIDESAVQMMHEDLVNVDWSVLESRNVNDGYGIFIEKVTESFNKRAPEKVKTVSCKKLLRLPWMTSGLLKSSLHCDKLYRKSVGCKKDDKRHINYVLYRNKYNNLKRSAKIAYYKTELDRYAGDSRKIWKLLNNVIGRNRNKSGIPDKFVVNGEEITDARTICNKFCNFFTNVGKNFAAKIPKSTRPYGHFLNQVGTESLFLQPCDSNEIEKLISNMKSKNSCGNDGVTSKLLKQLKNVISVPLSILINNSFSTGKFPDLLKVAKLCPIYKAKEKCLMSNYRPVSLLPNFSKIFEKVMHKRVYCFLKKHNLLYHSQYGFREKRSTVDAVTELMSNILLGFEKRKMTLGLFLDLSKAFDTVDHNILVNRLEHFSKTLY